MRRARAAPGERAAEIESTRSSAVRSPFYLFTLPAWQLVSGWLLTLAVMVAGDRGVLHRDCRGTTTASAARRDTGRRRAWRGLSIAVRRRAADARRQASTSGDTSACSRITPSSAGVTYTEAHVTLTGMLVVCGRARRSAR
mgnify:CR=1 FL=1